MRPTKKRKRKRYVWLLLECTTAPGAEKDGRMVHGVFRSEKRADDCLQEMMGADCSVKLDDFDIEKHEVL